MTRLLLLLLLVSFCSTFAIALDSDRDQPAIVDAEDIEIDLAAGLWTYRGNVTIQQGTLSMRADVIQLFFEDGILIRAVAYGEAYDGEPAIFEQQLEGTNHVLKARAREIDVDEVKNIAAFSGDAKLQQHRDIITGETIIYHMKTGKISVRGDASSLGQTRRLSASDMEIDEQSDQLDASRPKIMIQSSSDNVPVQTSNPPILDVGGQENKRYNIADNVIKQLTSDDNSLEFVAARVGPSGAGVYKDSNSSALLLGTLSEQIPVKVLEVRDDWARLTIPSGINVWVSDSYVGTNSDNQIIINGRGVRARWLPSTESQIVGIFNHLEEIRILGEKKNWKQVVLPSSIPAWTPLSHLDIIADVDPMWHDDWGAYSGTRSEVKN